jgi:hypothetical protein
MERRALSRLLTGFWQMLVGWGSGNVERCAVVRPDLRILLVSANW